MVMDLQSLNSRYAIPQQLSFQCGANQLLTAIIDNAYAKVEVTLAGAHIMSYSPHGEPPVFWISPNAAGSLNAAMRGGIPICWPWFANQTTDPSHKPMHGLVRTMLWSVTSTQACLDGSTKIHLEVGDTPETREFWPHAFQLEAIISVGKKLKVEWVARNPGSESYSYTGAFHPYFRVSDIRSISIQGLEQVDYLDKTDGFRQKTQIGALRIQEETDRIYLNTTANIAISDNGIGRTIWIAKEGSQTSVVWNPDLNDARMSDVGAGQHRNFVCVEAANASEDVVKVEPGGQGRLAMEIWTEQGARS